MCSVCAASRAPEGGAFGCPVCSAAVEVRVRLMPPAEETARVRAGLRELREEKKQRRRLQKRKRAADEE